jgi:hypothetical protein
LGDYEKSMKKLKFTTFFFAFIFASCSPKITIKLPPITTLDYYEIPSKTPSLTYTIRKEVISTITLTPTITKTVVPFTALSVSQYSCNYSNGPSQQLRSSGWTIKGHQFVEKSIGGGTITSNDFRFELLLYCDPIFHSTHNMSLWKVLINDVGIFYTWKYEGLQDDGPIESYFGIETTFFRSVSMNKVISGYMNYGSATVLFGEPNYFPDFEKGAKLSYIILIKQASGLLSGAKLSFDNKLIGSVVQINNVRITPMSNDQLLPLQQYIG